MPSNSSSRTAFAQAIAARTLSSSEETLVTHSVGGSVLVIGGAPSSTNLASEVACRRRRSCSSPLSASRSAANSRIVSSIQKRSSCAGGGSCRRATAGSRSASATSSAASRVQPPRNTARRAKRRCSSASSRSWVHSIVARSVCWRGSASRPPLSRSSRCDEALEDLRRGEDARPRGGQLERERQVVEAPAELGDRLVRLEPRARAEELDRLRLGQRRHRVLDLAADPQQLAARDEQLQVRAALEQASRARAPPRRPARSCRAAAAARARRCARRGRPSRRASARSSRSRAPGRAARQADPEDAGLERGHELGRPPRSRAASCPSRPARRA